MPGHRPDLWATSTPDDMAVHPAAEVFAAGVRHHHTANTAYPIAHEKTLRPYRVPRVRDQRHIKERINAAYGGLEEMMLYVHVPFCQQRCQFCEYTVVDPKQGKRDEVQDRYFDALEKEFDLYRDLLDTKRKRLVGFDIGGGTPSMASIDNIERVMQKMHDCFDFDPTSMAISIETTPKIAASDPEKIQAYYDMGIRRISMGVQTTDFALAEKLGRQDGDYLAASVENIRSAGFESFNIDLMYGFPLRAGAKDKWASTVEKTISELDPDHVTLYRMRYKGTKMAHLQERVGLQQVNEQGDVAHSILTDAGYTGWTGKNTFSRIAGDSGCSDYLAKRVMNGTPYIGLGLGAQSFSHSTLAYNLGGVTKRLDQYLKSVELGRIPVQDLYHLSPSGAWGKFCSVSFYFGGIDLPSFETNFGLSLNRAFPGKVAFAVENGLMQREGDRLQMTKLGKAHYGGVLALFYAPHIQQHLMELPGGEREATWYMGSASPLVNTETTHKTAVDPRRPYVGNALPRYERRRMKRSDPRTSLPSDWADIAASAGGRGLSTVSSYRNATAACAADTAVEGRAVGSYPELYEFGNILFAGPCNQQCTFCIGQQLAPDLSPRNTRQWPLTNLDRFVDEMNRTRTKRIIMTGTTTDPQLYKHEGRLVEHLRTEIPDCHLSIHTNGLLALQKLNNFNQYDTATLSVNSFNPETFRKIHGVRTMPDVGAIVKAAAPKLKLSCVLTADNIDEVGSYLETAARLGITRVALRHALDVGTGSVRLPTPAVLRAATPTHEHCGNPVYDIDGVEVTHWAFDETSGHSLNLFADGTLSPIYMLSKAPGARPTDVALLAS